MGIDFWVANANGTKLTDEQVDALITVIIGQPITEYDHDLANAWLSLSNTLSFEDQFRQEKSELLYAALEARPSVQAVIDHKHGWLGRCREALGMVCDLMDCREANGCVKEGHTTDPTVIEMALEIMYPGNDALKAFVKYLGWS